MLNEIHKFFWRKNLERREHWLLIAFCGILSVLVFQGNFIESTVLQEKRPWYNTSDRELWWNMGFSNRSRKIRSNCTFWLLQLLIQVKPTMSSIRRPLWNVLPIETSLEEIHMIACAEKWIWLPKNSLLIALLATSRYRVLYTRMTNKNINYVWASTGTILSKDTLIEEFQPCTLGDPLNIEKAKLVALKSIIGLSGFRCKEQTRWFVCRLSFY